MFTYIDDKQLIIDILYHEYLMIKADTNMSNQQKITGNISSIITNSNQSYKDKIYSAFI